MVFYPQFCTYHAIQYLLFSGISVVFILSVRCWNNKYLLLLLLLLMLLKQIYSKQDQGFRWTQKDPTGPALQLGSCFYTCFFYHVQQRRCVRLPVRDAHHQPAPVRHTRHARGL